MPEEYSLLISVAHWLFGNDFGRDPYNSTNYFIVQNPQGPIYQMIPDILNIVSFFLTILSVFLISSKAQNEQFHYKLSVITSHITLFLACLTWGTFMKPEFFFPVFALSCRGHLNFIACQNLWVIWIVFYSLFASSLCSSLLVRMRLTVRKNGPFYFSKRQCVLIITIFAIILPTIDIWLWYNCGYIGTDAYFLVRRNYPTVANYLDFRITVVFDVDYNLISFLILIILQFLVYLMTYLCGFLVIISEIRKRSSLISKITVRYHLTVLKEGMIQSAVLAVFMAGSPYIMFSFIFAKPDFDSRAASIISNSMFTSSPIPNVLIMIALKRVSYMNALQKVLRRMKLKGKTSSVAIVSKITFA